MTIFGDHSDPVAFLPRSNERVFIAITATGSDHTDAAIVPVDSTHALVWVDCDDSSKGVIIADTGVIGDTLKFIRPSGGEPFKVYRPNGTTLETGVTNMDSFFTPNGW